MTALSFNLTLFGQRLTGLRVPVGSTVSWNLTLLDPSTMAAIDLTAQDTVVVMSVGAIGIGGDTNQPALVERNAALPSIAPLNVCVVTWASSDTAPTGLPLTPGAYQADVWLETPTGRVQMASIGLWLTSTVRLPSDVVTT